MPPLVRLDTLGPVELTINGQPPPAEVLWRKHLALALLLASQPGRALGRDRLLVLLWPDRPEASARHSLNEALRVLRRAFGADAIVSTPDAVSWQAVIDSDAERFRASASTDPVQAARLVRGAWCDGFVVPGSGEFDEWITTERDRWRGRLVPVLTRAASLLADRGDVAEALTRAEMASVIDPWNDEAVQALMRCRRLASDRAGAVKLGSDHARRLADELGAEPAASTTAMLTRLRAEVDAPPGPTVGAGPTDRTVPLMRRADALAELMRCWRGANERHTGSVLLILGSSGTGRSRLLEAAADRLALEGVSRATIRALPGDGEQPEGGLAAIADAILLALPGVAGGDPAAIASLVTLRPTWAERFPSVQGAARLPLSDALLSVLSAAADEGAIAVVVDDAERLHAGSVDAIASLARSLGDRPVTWLMTAVHDSSNPAVTAFSRLVGRELPGAAVSVPPLDGDHAAELVEWAVPEWGADARARLVRRLLVEAGDSVFIAVELLLAIRLGLGLPDPATTWPAPERTLETTLPDGTPTTLTLALRYAFRQLPPEHQRCLQWIAVGVEPRPDRDFAAANGPDLQAARVLDQLETSRWLVSDDRGYQIAARAVRRFIAEDTLTPGQRRRLGRLPWGDAAS